MQLQFHNSDLSQMKTFDTNLPVSCGTLLNNDNMVTFYDKNLRKNLSCFLLKQGYRIPLGVTKRSRSRIAADFQQLSRVAKKTT